MFGLGATELIIILVIVLVIFGAGKLPKVMKDMGKGVKSFKDAMNEEEKSTTVESASTDQATTSTTIEGQTNKEKS
ncbi:MAG: twin-arginine translocase TatA/TatE family subunit [Magnetococcales bacterium]|nr:twin-arginine translocase TatA/TatE family subunit [Magnetococcales bacterium]